jgi:hypothetical protein
MGFRAAPLRQRIVFHPVLRTLLQSRALRALVCQYAETRGESAVFWRKALGLVRFAEAGGELVASQRRAA